MNFDENNLNKIKKLDIEIKTQEIIARIRVNEYAKRNSLKHDEIQSFFKNYYDTLQKKKDLIKKLKD